jgi:hypothetical protein
VSCFGPFWLVGSGSPAPQCHPVSPSVMFWRVLARRAGFAGPQMSPVSPGVMFWTVLARRVGFAGPQISPGVTRCHELDRFGSSHRVRRPPNFTRCHPVSCFGAFWRVASGSAAPKCHPVSCFGRFVSPGVRFWSGAMGSQDRPSSRGPVDRARPPGTSGRRCT